MINIGLLILSPRQPKSWFVGHQSNKVKKYRTKRGGSDAPRIQPKVIAIFHIKLKMFLRLCVKVVSNCKINCKLNY